MANYAIGDLQGCYKEFQDLLSQISFNEKKDKLWICGDLVNRGPESLQCLLYLHSIKNSCHIVLGNHDLHLIAVNQSIRKLSNDDTFKDILYEFINNYNSDQTLENINDITSNIAKYSEKKILSDTNKRESLLKF